MKKLKNLIPNIAAIIVLLALVATSIGMFMLQGRFHEFIWNSDLPWVLKAILS